MFIIYYLQVTALLKLEDLLRTFQLSEAVKTALNTLIRNNHLKKKLMKKAEIVLL